MCVGEGVKSRLRLGEALRLVEEAEDGLEGSGLDLHWGVEDGVSCSSSFIDSVQIFFFRTVSHSFTRCAAQPRQLFRSYVSVPSGEFMMQLLDSSTFHDLIWQQRAHNNIYQEAM